MKVNEREDNIPMIISSINSENNIFQNKKEDIIDYQKIQSSTQNNSKILNNFNNIIYNEENENQINIFKNCKNISEINNRGINQPESDVFVISTGCLFSSFPFIFFLLGSFFFFLIGIIYENSDNLELKLFFLAPFGFLFIAISFYMFYNMHNTIRIELSEKKIKIIKMAYCGEKIKTYGPGDLLSINFEGIFTKKENIFRLYLVHDVKLMHPVKLKEILFQIGGKTNPFTKEEIDYFNYYIKEHIKYKMIDKKADIE